MGTTTGRGKGFEERTRVSGERPIGAAGYRHQYNQTSCQPPPPPPPARGGVQSVRKQGNFLTLAREVKDQKMRMPVGTLKVKVLRQSRSGGSIPHLLPPPPSHHLPQKSRAPKKMTPLVTRSRSGRVRFGVFTKGAHRGGGCHLRPVPPEVWGGGGDRRMFWGDSSQGPGGKSR